MANAITLAKAYQTALDQVYKISSLTTALDAPASAVRAGMQANEILIPKISLQGLGTYGRNTGFVDGDVTFAYQTHTFTQDRGRSFQIDRMDNMETIDTAFAGVLSEFVRNYVVPEVDAYRFATLAASAGTAATPAILSATTALEAIDTGKEVMMEAEVPKERIIIYVSPSVYTFLKQSDLITRYYITNVGRMEVNREIETLDGNPVIVVPQSRFYTALTLYDGSTSGQEAGGYIKNASTGKDINFMLVDPGACLGITKTAEPRIFEPRVNQQRDAYKFDYRLYHDIFVPDNKTDGIYLHNKA
jgi:hypothetical protein